MKNRIIAFVALVICLGLQSCEKKPNPSDFSQVCFTKIDGSPDGGSCAGNWTFDVDFTKWESDLFTVNSAATTKNNASKQVLLYPNANNGIFNFQFDMDTDYTIDIVIINQQLQKIKQLQLSTLLTFGIGQVDISNNVSNGDFLRYYYVATAKNNSSIVHRGFGNIAIKK
ncbi:MAG: hypothetical protein RL660_2825 [Bacteroidota bacterium]|jgi:hypothetical protein